MTTAANEARLEMPFGHIPPDICCPACGKGVIGAGGCAGCAHVIVAYESFTGEATYVSPKYTKAFEELKQDGDSENLARIFLKGLTKASILKLEIAFGGIGHGGGPISERFIVAVDFAPEEND